MRADDIRKGDEFEQLCHQTTNERQQEENLCDHFITSSRQRDEKTARHLSQMINDQINYLNHSCLFWKLDPWEDDLRRRRRLIPDLNDNLHEQNLENLSFNEINEENMLKDESLLKQIKQQKIQNFLQDENEDLSQIDEKDVEHDFSGPIHYSTECLLINGILSVQGILSITHNSMLFDAKEEENLDSKVINRNYFILFIILILI
jgi:hypothetical protein